MKEKVVTLDGYDFNIAYALADYPANYTQGNCTGLIQVTYKPKKRELLHETIAVVSKRNEQLLDEIEKIIQENSDFYSRFEYKREFVNHIHYMDVPSGENYTASLTKDLVIDLKQQKKQKG